MASTADIEYLRRRRASKLSNQAGGTQVLQNGNDTIQSTSEDASWTAIAQNPGQAKDTGGRFDNPWTRTIDTVQNAGLNILDGLFQGVRGLVNAGAYVVGLFGDDKFKEGVQDFMNYDWTAPVKAIYRQLDPSIIVSGNIGSEEFRKDWVENWTHLGDQVAVQQDLQQASNNSYASDWGQVGNVIQSVESGVGSVLGNMVSNAVVPGSGALHAAGTLGMMGVSSFGSGATEAMNDGADYLQAGGSGAISGAIETGTELASAGLGKLLGIGSHIAGQSIGKQASKGIVKELLHNAMEEGTEELVSELMSPLAKLPYKDMGAVGDEYLHSDLYKNALVSFLGGAVGGAFSGGVNAFSMRKAYGPKIFDVSAIQEEISDIREASVKEARKGKSADQSLIDKYDNRIAELASQFDKTLQEMKAEDEANGTSYYDNFLRAIKDPQGALKNLEAGEYLSTHDDVVKSLGKSTYDTLADRLSSDRYTFIVDKNAKGFQGEGSTDNKAYIDNGAYRQVGRNIYINPRYQAEFFGLVAHESIGHAWLDGDTNARKSFIDAIEADETLKKVFHELDPQLEKAYAGKPNVIESERVAHFIERMVSDSKLLGRTRAFSDNASLRGRLRSLLNRVKNFIKAKLGDNSAKTIEQLNKALKAIERREADYEERTYTVGEAKPQLAYSKALDYNELFDDLDDDVLDDFLELADERGYSEEVEETKPLSEDEQRINDMEKAISEDKTALIKELNDGMSDEAKKFFERSVIRTGKNMSNSIWSYGESGLLVPMFHGTPNKGMFYFDSKKIGKNGTVRGPGFYLTDNLDYAKGYMGKNGKVIMSFVNITNPLSDSASKSRLTKANIKEFIRKYIDPSARIGMLSDWGDVSKERYDSILERYVNEITKYNKNDWDVVTQIYHDQNELDFDGFFGALEKEFGFDGYVAWNRAEGTIALAFRSNQVKDILNTNPTDSRDIRYSKNLDDIDYALDEDSLGPVRKGKGTLNRYVDVENSEVTAAALQRIAYEFSGAFDEGEPRSRNYHYLETLLVDLSESLDNIINGLEDGTIEAPDLAEAERLYKYLDDYDKEWDIDNVISEAQDYYYEAEEYADEHGRNFTLEEIDDTDYQDAVDRFKSAFEEYQEKTDDVEEEVEFEVEEEGEAKINLPAVVETKRNLPMVLKDENGTIGEYSFVEDGETYKVGPIQYSTEDVDFNIPADYVKDSANLNNDKVYAYSVVEKVLARYTHDLLSIAGMLPEKASDWAKVRVLLNNQSRAKAVDELFRTLNKKNVTVEEITNRVIDVFGNATIKVGANLIDVAQLMDENTEINDAVRNSINAHILELAGAGKDSFRTKVEKRFEAFKAIYKDMRKALVTQAKEMRSRINPNRTMRHNRDDFKKWAAYDKADTVDNGIYRVASSIVEPIISVDSGTGSGYKTFITRLDAEKKPHAVSLRSELEAVRKDIYNADKYGAKDENGNPIDGPLFPFDPVIASQIDQLIESLPAEPKIKEIHHKKDYQGWKAGEVEKRQSWPAMTAAQTKLANAIYRNVKSLMAQTKQRARETQLPLGQGAIYAVESALATPTITGITSNFYIREFASSYVVTNSVLGGSRLATEMTIGMDQALAKKDAVVDGQKKRIRKHIEKIAKTLQKTVKVQAVNTEVEVTRDTLIDAYCTLKSSNLDAMNKNGAVVMDKKGRTVNLWNPGVDGGTKFLAMLEETLTEDEKAFGDWLSRHYYNDGQLQNIYVKAQKARGIVEVELLKDYYPRAAEGETVTNVEQMVKALWSFGHDRARVNHNLKFVIGSSVARAMAFADSLGTLRYVRPQYMKVINALNIKNADGENAWNTIKKNFPKQAEIMRNMLGMYMGVDPREKSGSRALGIFYNGYTKSLLAFNPGTPFRQTISALYSNFGAKRIGRALLDKFFGNKALKSVYRDFIKDLAEIRLRARDNNPIMPAVGAGQIWEAVQKLGDFGMKPIEFMDSWTIKVLLLGSMRLAQDCGYAVGTAEYKQAVRDFLCEALLTQIGRKPTNLSAAAAGYGKTGSFGGLLTFMGGPARAALAATSDKIKTASIVHQRGLTEEGVKANYEATKSAKEQAESDYAIAEENLALANETEGADTKEAQEALEQAYNKLLEAKTDYEQAIADKHTWAKYVAMGGGKWPLDAIIMMIVASLFNALIGDFSKRARGKKDWTDGIDPEEYFQDALLYGTLGWLPVVNSVSNAIKGYDTSYPAGALISDMTTLASTITALISNPNEKNTKTLIRTLIGDFSRITGLPIKTVYQEIYAGVNAVNKDAAEALNGLFYTTYATTSADIAEAVEASDYKEVARLVNKQFSERIGTPSEAVKEEIVYLYKNDVTVAPTSIGTTYKNTADTEVTLTWTQQQNARMMYSKANVAVAKLLTKSYYKKLDADSKGYMVQAMYNAYRQGALRSVLSGSYTANKVGIFASSGANSVGDILSAVFYIRQLEATSSKSKKELAVEYVNRLGLSKNDKLLVLHLAGYSVDTDSVTRALRQKGLSKSDIKAIVN